MSLHGTPDLAATLRAIAGAAQTALSADRATCYVLTPTGVVDAIYTTETQPRSRAFLESTVGLSAEQIPIWRHYRALADPLMVCENVRDDTEIPAALVDRLRAGAFLGVRLEHPAVIHDGLPIPLGTLFCSYRRPRTITLDDRLAARTLARLAELALANAQMESDAAQRAELYRTLDAKHAALHRIATQVASEAHPDALFAQVATEVAELLGVDAAIVARFTPGWATIRGACGIGAQRGQRIPMVGNGVLAQMSRSGQPAAMDRSLTTDADPSCAVLPLRHGYQAWAAVPIDAGGRLWGALLASTTRTGGLPAGAQTHLEPFADLVSLAITNAEARARLTAQATTDPLTGLANYGALFERSHAEHTRANRHGNPLSLVLLDLDYFKRINASFGHLTGDRVLMEVAERLSTLVREEDTLARVGGQKFAWLLPNSNAAAAWTAAERARRAIAHPEFSNVGPLSVSGGVAELAPGMSINELFRRAGVALARAKSFGRNTCAPYDPMYRAAPDGSGTGVRPAPKIARLLDLAREQLGIALVAVAQFEGHETVWRHFSGDGEAFGVHLGDATPLDYSYGQQIADGRPPYMIRDTRADPRTRDLPLTKVAGTGAYVGVPITRSGGDQFGVLYGLSHRAEPSLGERDVRLIQILAKMVSEEIERASDAGAGQRASHGRIQRMVSGEGISIVLQPIVELSSGRVIAAEALTRFVSTPRRPPNEWFSEAASAGLGVELELAAISVAITKLGHLPPRARLSINASPQTLLSEGFRAVVAGVPGARLAVELTEHAPVDDYHALTTALASLRATGVQLMVDDAGAGFASLKHILGLRPDLIKLDLALTRDIDTDPMRRALTASLVGFGREISATLVAEGIETRSALETLRALGVTYGQGHFLARPTRGRVSERVDLGDGSRAAAQRPRHPHHDGSAGMRRVQRSESAVLASDL